MSPESGKNMQPTKPVHKRKKAAEPKVSRTQKPDGMSLEEWQTQLRRQFGREQNFRLKNVGANPAFSEFLVTNPESRRTYRVTVRGPEPGDNACTCPDFATNTLGTCKHIEFTLAKLERTKKGRDELKAGYRPPHGEVVLRYGSRRQVCFARPRMANARRWPSSRRSSSTQTACCCPTRRAGSTSSWPRRVKHDAGPARRRRRARLPRRSARRRRSARQTRCRGVPAGHPQRAFKDLLKVPLYDYQREGVLFAAQAGRCLIGDEMGLGKTVQAIAAPRSWRGSSASSAC